MNLGEITDCEVLAGLNLRYRTKLQKVKEKLHWICPICLQPTEDPKTNAHSWQCDKCLGWHREAHDAPLIK